MDVTLQKQIFEFIGGLGLFVFAITYLGEGLQKSTGERLRKVIDTFTSNPIIGVFAGMISTILVQSSSGMIIIVLGLVSARFMTLRQAIGVIMGANIGTTLTAFIIGINFSSYFLPALAVGSMLIVFFYSKKVHYIGQVIFGFGALFLGLELMGDGMREIVSLDIFQDFILNMGNNPFFGVSMGTIFTAVVQKSSVSIGVLQELYKQDSISLTAALPVLFGANIGTTVTVVLASLSASVLAKRAALTHVLLNVSGTIVFLAFLPVFTAFISVVQVYFHLNGAITIAVAHAFFNIFNTLLWLPFVGVLVYLVTKALPERNTFATQNQGYLDRQFIEQAPTVALSQVQKEIIEMSHLLSKNFAQAYSYLSTRDRIHAQEVANLMETLESKERKIKAYFLLLSENALSTLESEDYFRLQEEVHYLKRIGAHCENITEFVDYQLANKVFFTNEASSDLEEMFQSTSKALSETIKALESKNIKSARSVLEIEDRIDRMERVLRKKHILRLNEGECSGAAGILFVDIINNLERIGDYAEKLSQHILEQNNS
ncbi:Na/Pi cotransporter family protein [Priestia endophytica]|uniref:Phosphate:Na+ symporter n=1 Tax=Priestia endophytica DSM 13796 TaxID=1121089 RepID=A0A1I5WDU7_9BACI|nr:Na/Pi cotransporter family protein [Priestia endophytica]KYG36089.1 sodium-dependent phosphate transporter [Priestia endophytica]MBG9815030.1 sodium-dependent phosphate transporter [Priestia endophytica]SFQ17818.1 phosphate:Na+ symporter [Priestia endophytica DSM 13796]